MKFFVWEFLYFYDINILTCEKCGSTSKIKIIQQIQTYLNVKNVKTQYWHGKVWKGNELHKIMNKIHILEKHGNLPEDLIV